MKFTCEQSALNGAVSTAGRAASPKSPIPALEGLLIAAEGGVVRVTGYNLKKGVYTTFPAEVAEPGAAVLSARLLGDMVRSLPDGRITLSVPGGMARLRCGQSEFSMPVTDPADYPELPTIDPEDTVSLSQKTLKKMIAQTLFAISDNESRPVYTGSRFEIENGLMTLVSVDGYRLALCREAVDAGGKDLFFIVPGSALADVERLCGDGSDPIRVSLGKRHISFSLGETILITRRLEGEFLSWRKAVPDGFRHRLTVGREELRRVVERVSLVVDERTKNPLRCVFQDGCVQLSCVTPLGRAEDVCQTEGDGGNVEIGFNSRYLLDALKSAPAERLEIRLNTGASPCVLAPAEGDGFLFMILPVRLKTD